MVICEKCQKEKEQKDFINGTDECYKCVYFRKIGRNPSNREASSCRMCHSPCTGSRWIYCSVACSRKGHHEQKKTYWRNRVR